MRNRISFPPVDNSHHRRWRRCHRSNWTAADSGSGAGGDGGGDAAGGVNEEEI